MYKIKWERHPAELSVVSAANCHTSVVTAEKSAASTIRVCGNASGQQIPPSVVFSGVHKRQDTMEGTTPGANFDMKEFGLSNSIIFMEYMEEHSLHLLPEEDDQKLFCYTMATCRSHLTPYWLGHRPWPCSFCLASQYQPHFRTCARNIKGNTWVHCTDTRMPHQHTSFMSKQPPVSFQEDKHLSI